MADLDLSKLERLEKAATPGPWEGPWGDTHTVAAFEGELNEHSLTRDPRGDAFPVTQYTHPNDAALIAVSRNALPELLRRLRAAEVELAAWKAQGSAGTIRQWREDAERWRTAMRLLCGCTATHYTFQIPAPKLSSWDFQGQFTAAIDAERGKRDESK